MALQRAAYAVETARTGITAIPQLTETAARLAGSGLTVLAHLEGGEPVSMLGYTRAGAVVDTDRLVVRPDRFRRGLGRSLLAALHAAESDAARFDVATGAGNAPAAALYAACGYRRTGLVEVRPGVQVEGFVRRVELPGR